ncbi:hypothetical protein [Bacillus sp. OK048]|uniref:hypothetical protein n=1 Tax=Bacillus sp. OK048 TaxID=1882761 RepID=UPI00088E14E4|nr:hypothetical protein [Bacillus sp. OK048]SDN40006.1 hypothetical protein SAMN05443253_111102 [Bacillus sp. OK048]
MPGSGKTTTAKLINDILEELKIKTKLFLEGDFDHPADYESSSFFTKIEFAELLEQYAFLKSTLLKHAIECCDGYVLSRYKLKQDLGETTVPESFWNTIWAHDIYELPLEKNIELITEKWQRFAGNAKTSELTYIFECCFIQNPVTIGMIKNGASQDVVMSYVKKLADSIESLNPILIYVDQQDLSQSFTKAVQERPKEWSNGFMNYYNDQGYGKMHGAKGMDGTIAVLKARNQLESTIYDELDMVKFKIDNSYFDLNLHKNRLMAQFKIN